MRKFGEQRLDQAISKLFTSLDELDSSIDFLLKNNKNLKKKMEHLAKEKWNLSTELKTLKDELSQWGDYTEKYKHVIDICKELSSKIDKIIEFIEIMEKNLG